MMESIGTIMDPSRDIETLNENIELDFPESECDRSEQPLSINFDQSMTYLNPLDSGSDADYRFNTGKLQRHDLFIANPIILYSLNSNRLHSFRL